MTKLSYARTLLLFGGLVLFSLVVALPANESLANNGPKESLAVDPLSSTSTYFTVRRDLRRCAFPSCGGYFVKRVNQQRTLCSNGRYANECYVAEIDWNRSREVDAEKALLRGHIVGNLKSPLGRFGRLRVRESWEAAGTNSATGNFFRVRDRGLRCITHPCLTHHEARLNSTIGRNIAGVELSEVGATDALLQNALTAMTTREGILVSGSHRAVTGPGGRAQMLVASQFYLRAQDDAGSAKPCMKTGCSGQVCSDEEVVTTCEYRPEYDCYKRARCERQANGQCGFTPTRELTECLNRSRRP